MKFSIIICTYNTNFELIKYTIDSILCQNMNEYEIIVCDDGSTNNNNELIIEYFRSKSFENFKMIMNEENKGTVKNIESGLKYSKGEYIKPIGAGDAFKDNNSLEKIYNFMKHNQSKCTFCDLECFVNYNNERKSINKCIPIFKRNYLYNKKDSILNMKKNIIVINDHISGASMFYERKTLLKYLTIIDKYVLYMEDLVQYLFLLDGINIDYYPNACIKYEIGTGLSTNASMGNNKRMSNDKRSFLRYIFNEYENDIYVKRRLKLEYIENTVNNKILKGIIKSLNEPKWLYLKIIRIRGQICK